MQTFTKLHDRRIASVKCVCDDDDGVNVRLSGDDQSADVRRVHKTWRRRQDQDDTRRPPDRPRSDRRRTCTRKGQIPRATSSPATSRGSRQHVGDLLATCRACRACR